MSLFAEIQAKCSPELIASGNYHAIAEAVNVGRTRLTPYEIGHGMVLEVLGLATGNALLDAVYAAPDFRHVKPLLEQGRLRLDSAIVQATLASLVGTVLTQADVDNLNALCTVADPVTWDQCQAAVLAGV